MDVSIITPSYNRANLLKNVYDSLVNQTNPSFEWIVIDDGSTDNTKKVVEDFIKENKIKIQFFQKENGGKHTAVNLGIDYAKGELMLILDSDDTLTEDAISTILEDWKKYRNNIKIAGLSYNKKLMNLEEVGGRLKTSPYLSNHIACRYNEGYFADRMEVYRTSVMKKYKFPVFEHERFLSEAIIWNQIAYQYDTVYIDKYLYIAEYQLDGLTSSSQKARINSPIGSMENYRIMMKKPFRLKLRIKYSILYNAFASFAKVSGKDRFKNVPKVMTLITKPMGDMVYFIWRKKYLG